MTKRRNRDYTSTLPRPLPAEVKRTVLLKRIAQADNANLVVLVAPSGYGKTTLLGQVARASKHAAWLTLSDRHADLKTLTDALMASVSQTAKEATFGRVRKAVAEGAQVAALATLFARELDELAVNVKILVDQTHLLGDDALAWLEQLALALGEGHQLIHCAYDLASERLAAPLASGNALLLTTSDLAFSEDESRAYLSARGSSADAFEVHNELEGWPAGVGLAAAGVGHVLSHEELLKAAFDRLPEDVREALPEASVLEVWREADAAQLGCALPKGWLKEARRAGLPMAPLSAQACRPHKLVVEILDRELQGREERYKELHARVGHEAAEHDHNLTALRHFQKAGQVQNALRVAEVIVPQLDRRAEYSLTIKLLGFFQEADLSPSLAATYGGALIHSEYADRGEAILKTLYERNQGGARVFIHLCTRAKMQGEVTRMLELAEEGSSCTDDAIDVIRIKISKASALVALGKYDEALTFISELTGVLEASQYRLQLAGLLGHLGRLYYDVGKYLDCELTIRKALSIYEDLQIGALDLLGELSELLRCQNRLSEASSVCDHAFGLANQRESATRAGLLALRGDIFMNQTEWTEAAEKYREALILFDKQGHKHATQTLRYRLFDALQKSEDHASARYVLSEAFNERWMIEVAEMNGLQEFCKALDDFISKDVTAAQQGFETALSVISCDPELSIRAYVYLLEIARQNGVLKKEDVITLIKKLNELGHDATLWVDAEPLKPLYEECVARGWFAERFAPFTKAYPKAINERTRSVLNVRTFEDISAALDGKPIKMPFAKAAELLVWLALYGPASREKIFDALWDGSNDPRHIEYGKLALRRLRTTLAEHVSFNPLVYADRQYRIADELEIKVDAKDALKVFEEGDDTARREALEHYGSTFLPGVTSEWVELMRVKLHNAALSTAMGLGTSCEHNDIPSATWAYRKAVEIEPLSLDSHCALVRLLQTNGDQVGARLAYQTYLRVLKTEYGETPDLTFDDMLYKAQPNQLN